MLAHRAPLVVLRCAEGVDVVVLLTPRGPTSIGEAAPKIAGARESPLTTSTRVPCRRAHSYASVVAYPESTAIWMMGNSSPKAVVNVSFRRPVNFSHTSRRAVSPSKTR